MANQKKNDINLQEQLDKLARIADWFERQEQVDVEKGLDKAREAAGLVQVCQKRLTEVENEFEEIKPGLQTEA